MLPHLLFFLCIIQSSVTENRNHCHYFKHEGQRASNRELDAYRVLRLSARRTMENTPPRKLPTASVRKMGNQGVSPELFALGTVWILG